MSEQSKKPELFSRQWLAVFVCPEHSEGGRTADEQLTATHKEHEAQNERQQGRDVGEELHSGVGLGVRSFLRA